MSRPVRFSYLAEIAPMSDNDDFRIFLVDVDGGRVHLLGRIIGTATAVTAEIYSGGAWHYRPQLNAWLEGQSPGLAVEIDESEVPRYMKMIDDQSAKARGAGT